jgi:hypothetical protein
VIRLKNELYHHGIQGQEWGKRNGPPYPLSRSEHRRIVKSAKLAKKRNLNYSKARRNASKLTDDDLDLALDRLRREKEYTQLVSKPGTEPQRNDYQTNKKVFDRTSNEKKSRGGSFAGDLAKEALKKLAIGLVGNYIGDQKKRMDDMRKEEARKQKEEEQKQKDMIKAIQMEIPKKIGGMKLKVLDKYGRYETKFMKDGKEISGADVFKMYTDSVTKNYSGNLGKLTDLKAKGYLDDTGYEKAKEQNKSTFDYLMKGFASVNLDNAKYELVQMKPELEKYINIDNIRRIKT